VVENGTRKRPGSQARRVPVHRRGIVGYRRERPGHAQGPGAERLDALGPGGLGEEQEEKGQAGPGEAAHPGSLLGRLAGWIARPASPVLAEAGPRAVRGQPRDGASAAWQASATFGCSP